MEDGLTGKTAFSTEGPRNWRSQETYTSSPLKAEEVVAAIEAAGREGRRHSGGQRRIDIRLKRFNRHASLEIGPYFFLVRH